MDEKTIKRERDVFIKLAFCRADLLFELDGELAIIFAAGATPMLFSTTPEELKGQPFLGLIDDKYRANVEDLLGGGGKDGRIEDAVLKVKGPNGVGVIATIAGFQAPEFDDHYFLALKIGSASEKYLSAEVADEAADGDLLDQAAFSHLAAERLEEYSTGEEPGQLTMIRIKNIKDLVKTLGASDRHGLISAIGGILKSYSIGGNTAGQIDAENFGYVHGKNVDPEMVNMEIEDTAQEFLAEGDALETKSSTLDADGASMSEEQVAKALVYTIPTDLLPMAVMRQESG